MHRRRTSRRVLTEALAFACGALAAIIICGACLFFLVPEQTQVETTAETSGLEVSDKTYRPVPQGTYMPTYMQRDVQWCGVPYAGGTIGDSGCGVACAAMAVKYITTQDVTPLTLADAVGDACLTDGVNDPKKFAYWIAAHYAPYGIEVSPTVWATDNALSYVNDGWLCFGGLHGAIGDSTYGGHVVLIWKNDENGYWLRDPASPGNSARPFTKDELNEVDFAYFVCIRGGFYGDARH